jgi:DNA-binding NtrC family response regulator
MKREPLLMPENRASDYLRLLIREPFFLMRWPSLSLAAQAKLLLAIESGKIRRVGGSKDLFTNVRIIAAANQDLRKMITEGQFREDLFHRLDLLRISIPPLSLRGKDLPKLADHFLKALSQKYRLPKPQMDESFQKYLCHHSWPGNIRELLHELERSVVLCEPGNKLSLANHTLSSCDQSGTKRNNRLAK